MGLRGLDCGASWFRGTLASLFQEGVGKVGVGLGDFLELTYTYSVRNLCALPSLSGEKGLSYLNPSVSSPDAHCTHVGITVVGLVVKVTQTPLYLPRGEEVNKAVSPLYLLRWGASVHAKPLPPVLPREAPASGGHQCHLSGLTHLVAWPGKVTLARLRLSQQLRVGPAEWEL